MAIILEPNPATSAEIDTASGVTNRTVPGTDLIGP